MSALDPKLEVLLQAADFSDDQKQSLRDTWTTIKVKGHADTLSTQQAIFSFALATAMAEAVNGLRDITSPNEEQESKPVLLDKKLEERIFIAFSDLQNSLNSLNKSNHEKDIKAQKKTHGLVQVTAVFCILNLAVMCAILLAFLGKI